MRVKNWEKFQHFKDRRPPWIKLYRDLLDDVEWHELSGDDSKTLVMIWLIASEGLGELPDKKSLSFRLRMTTKQLEAALNRLSHWLITDRYQDDIKVSQIKSVADVSNHQETETETETETESTNVLCLASKTPSQQLIDLFHSKCGYLPKITVINESRKRTLKARYTEVMREEGWTPEKTLEWFADFYEIVNQSKFLTGRAAAVNGHRVFRADWDWVHNPNNFVKIVEGKYNGG
jgi:hypothetical protein